MTDKKGFEFSFSWLFAIIVGAAAIFFAIYASVGFIKNQTLQQDTEIGKSIGIILNPIETNLEEGKSSKISLQINTRIFNECSLSGKFGSQLISTSTKPFSGSDWASQSVASSFHNKYIFSPDIAEGKIFTVFSKPVMMPFKIADLIYLLPENEKFCLINAPLEIEEEVLGLNLKNFDTEKSSDDECELDYQTVCFARSGCDIDVTLDQTGKISGSLKKKRTDRVYFSDTVFFYAALLSTPEIYECHVKRLMNRASELSWAYYGKTILLTPKGCSSNLEMDLSNYANKTLSFSNSADLRQISQNAENLRRRNNDLSCKLF